MEGTSYSDLSHEEKLSRRKAQKELSLEQMYPFLKQEKSIRRSVGVIVRDKTQSKAIRIVELEQIAYDIAKQADDIRDELTPEERWELIEVAKPARVGL
jgi:hypothetical protein